MKVGQVPPGAAGGGPAGRSGGASFGRALQAELDGKGLKFSAHARKRLAERRIDLGHEDMDRLNQALDQARSKGVKETLLIYGGIALVASVANRTVVTALEGPTGKVFTNNDGAVIVPK